MVPEIEVVEEVSEANWQERERFWIAFYHGSVRLTNLHAGGTGTCHGCAREIQVQPGMKKGQKLTLADAQEIRRQATLGVSNYRLAKDYGVSQVAIGKIVKRLIHKEPISPIVSKADIQSKDRLEEAGNE